jgi:hypothetical protein
MRTVAVEVEAPAVEAAAAAAGAAAATRTMMVTRLMMLKATFVSRACPCFVRPLLCGALADGRGGGTSHTLLGLSQFGANDL